MMKIAFGFWSLVLAGCGGSLTDNDAGDAGFDASDHFAQDAPADTPLDSFPTTGDMTFALYDIFLGESDRNHVNSASAWKSFGRNIDGLVTSNASTGVCTLAQGAPLANQVDGNNGIDNTWGAVIVPILQSAASLASPSLTVSQSIQSGSSTLLFNFDALTADPSQTAAPLFAQLFGGSTYGSTPAFDMTTVWPVLASSVKDGQTIAGGAAVQFPGSSITKGTFTTPAVTTAISWSILFQGVPLPLTIHAPLISFDHTDAADLTNGTISGVLDTEEFITALQAVAGTISTSLCGAAFDGIAQQIRQAQDIMKDGTNGPNQACNGISIGLGFNAKRVGTPTTVVPDPVTVNPCP